MYQNLLTPENSLLWIPLLFWSLFWKGLALWRAARDEQKPWFVALLVINSVGILEIIYLLFFAKQKLSLPSQKSKKKK